MPCSILSSSELACKTPEIAVTQYELNNMLGDQPRDPVQLFVHLGVGSDVLNESTEFRFSFKIYENPTIDEWGDEPQNFNLYDDAQTHIQIFVC